MKKRILIPTDFSANALNAIKYAMELFKSEHCEFFILHSYYLAGYSKDNLLTPVPSDEAREAVKLKAEKNMEKFKLQMGLHEANPFHDFNYTTEFGTLYDIMNKTVQQEDIELVIMGTQGQTDNASVILGSNAVNIMEKIRHCPVMAIPSSQKFKAPNEIVFPTSFRTHYKQKELNTLVEIARLTNSPIRVLHIRKDKPLTEAQLKNKALLETILEPAAFTHHRLFNIAVNDGVRCFVQSRDSDMIAFVNKKHNFFGSIFSNPMVKELGRHANVPLLAMHDVRS